MVGARIGENGAECLALDVPACGTIHVIKAIGSHFITLHFCTPPSLSPKIAHMFGGMLFGRF